MGCVCMLMKKRLFQLGDFVKASEARTREMELYEQLKELKVNLNEESELSEEITNYVLESHVADVVSSWTGIPVTRLNEASFCLIVENIDYGRAEGIIDSFDKNINAKWVKSKQCR